MNGLATRKKLQAAVHPDVHGDVSPVPHERRGHTFLGYRRYADDEEIPEPTFLPNAHGLGTPMEGERIKAARRERLYDKAFRIGGAIIVILVALGGYGWSERKPQPQPMRTRADYHVSARSLAAGETITLKSNSHEDCMVSMHKDAIGKFTHSNVAWHC